MAAATPHSDAAARPVEPPGDGAPLRPVTMVREYRRAQEYERDAAQLCRRGWKVISVLERPAPAGRLERATHGVLAQAFPSGPELLVTYTWESTGRHPVPAGTSPRGGLRRLPAALRRWWWLAALLLITLLLAYGLIDFIAQ